MGSMTGKHGEKDFRNIDLRRKVVSNQGQDGFSSGGFTVSDSLTPRQSTFEKKKRKEEKKYTRCLPAWGASDSDLKGNQIYDEGWHKT